MKNIIDVESLEDLAKNKSNIYSNTKQNIILRKTIHGLDSNDEIIAGIDEAGRGPVLGHMLFCAFYARKSDIHILEKLGCDDSKKFTPAIREQLFEKICNEPKLGFVAKALSPCYISSSSFNQVKYNLNQMSWDTAVEILSEIKTKNIVEIYADTVGTPEKYAKFLKNLFPTSKVVVKSKADSEFKVVGAASICAKVIRDFILDNWEFTEDMKNREFGSGYTSDPITIKWLNDVVHPTFGFPDIVRFSWSTCAKIMLNRCSKMTWRIPILPQLANKKRKYTKNSKSTK